MEKYTGHKVPDESILRKNYASGDYKETVSKIQQSNIFGLDWMKPQTPTVGVPQMLL